MTNSLTKVQIQLEAAAIAVAELIHLGCRVISVRAFEHDDRAQILIADPGNLLDAIDAQWVDTSGLVYKQLGLIYGDCEVVWLVRRLDVVASTEAGAQ